MTVRKALRLGIVFRSGEEIFLKKYRIMCRFRCRVFSFVKPVQPVAEYEKKNRKRNKWQSTERKDE